jgi:hypothetical protein
MTADTTPAAETAQERWARTRSIGRTGFIWRYGVVAWGLPGGTVTAIYRVIQLHARGTEWSLHVIRPLWESVAGIFVACGIVGYLLGAWLWDACESQFAPDDDAASRGP